MSCVNDSIIFLSLLQQTKWMLLNISIIDDDKLSRHIIKKYIENTDELRFQSEYESALEASKDKDLNQTDLIILDVEMPQLSGLDFLAQADITPQVIITSINRDYAVRAFDFDVIDFLAKPVPYGRFLQGIQRAKTRKKEKSGGVADSDHIYIKCNNGYSRIDFDEILYIEAYSDYMNIYTTKERLTALSTMKAIEERLPNSKFIRVHRSFIVCLDKINRFEDNMVLIGDKVIPVSRSCKDKLVSQLNFF